MSIRFNTGYLKEDPFEKNGKEPGQQSTAYKKKNAEKEHQQAAVVKGQICYDPKYYNNKNG